MSKIKKSKISKDRLEIEKSFMSHQNLSMSAFYIT